MIRLFEDYVHVINLCITIIIIIEAETHDIR